jgi:putative FmdB family regulatory protein
MPSYEFSCDACGTYKILEASVFADLPAPNCDTCSESMRRIFSVPPVKFLGGGFYSTDNPRR